MENGEGSLSAAPRLTWSGANFLPTTTYQLTPDCRFGIDGGTVFQPNPGVTSWWMNNNQSVNPNSWPAAYACSADFSLKITACNGASCSSRTTTITVMNVATGG
jgi:hypothetical protein